MITHVYILGSRGLPAYYGGFETFVLKLTEYSSELTNIKYHVSCLENKKDESEFNSAERFYIKPFPIGNAKAIVYDLFAFIHAINDIRKNKYKKAWIYILACRIGPFMRSLTKIAHKYGIKVAINPDGHEWLRGKWNRCIKHYWRMSEKLMVKETDLVICDSKEIEKYIKEEYQRYTPRTFYLSYGVDENDELCSDEELSEWYKKFGIKKGQYYLVIGRFVPENNYEFIIREFINSTSTKNLVIITNYSSGRLKNALRKTGFEKDKRVIFVGTVYQKNLINRIRKEAFFYFHGHEVGGTNPSLLEAMGCGCCVCAVDVPFSREVLGENGIYFKKMTSALTDIINHLEERDEYNEIKKANKERVLKDYNWRKVAQDYMKLFTV